MNPTSLCHTIRHKLRSVNHSGWVPIPQWQLYDSRELPPLSRGQTPRIAYRRRGMTPADRTHQIISFNPLDGDGRVCIFSKMASLSASYLLTCTGECTYSYYCSQYTDGLVLAWHGMAWISSLILWYGMMLMNHDSVRVVSGGGPRGGSWTFVSPDNNRVLFTLVQS